MALHGKLGTQARYQWLMPFAGALRHAIDLSAPAKRTPKPEPKSRANKSKTIFSDDDIREIRALRWIENKSYGEIAGIFGAGKAWVYAVCDHQYRGSAGGPSCDMTPRQKQLYREAHER